MLFQIETDKVTIDVRAPQSGTLEAILVCLPFQCASSPAIRVNNMCASCSFSVSGASCGSIDQSSLPYTEQSMPDMYARPDIMKWPLQVKDDETVTVGQVLAKIAAGEAPSQPAGQEDASAGAAPAESTAFDTETKPDSGIYEAGPCTRALRFAGRMHTYRGRAGQTAQLHQ